MITLRIVRARPYAALARYYDRTLGVPFLRRARRSYLAMTRRFGLRPRAVADLGAGTGLFARWLARRHGIRVYAVERSRHMLAIAARRACGTSVVPVLADIRRLSLPEPVDLAVANHDTVNHLLTPADVRLGFAAVARALVPGGFFLFDVITGHQSPVPLRHQFRCGPGVRLTQVVRHVPARRLLLVSIHLRRRRSPCRVVERHRERIYPLADLAEWLRRAGFLVRELRDAESLEPVGTRTSVHARVLIVAQLRLH